MQEHKAEARCRGNGEASLEDTCLLVGFSRISSVTILQEHAYGKGYGDICEWQCQESRNTNSHGHPREWPSYIL